MKNELLNTTMRLIALIGFTFCALFLHLLYC
jgi:hypothetical protein